MAERFLALDGQERADAPFVVAGSSAPPTQWPFSRTGSTRLLAREPNRSMFHLEWLAVGREGIDLLFWDRSTAEFVWQRTSRSGKIETLAEKSSVSAGGLNHALLWSPEANETATAS